MKSKPGARMIRGPQVLSCAARFIRDPIPVLRSLNREHGNLVAFPNDPFRQRGDRLYVMAFGPVHNERILTDTEVFRSRGIVPRGPPGSAQEVVRHGLISMNGEQHRRHRTLLMPAFHRRAVEGYGEAMACLTTRMVERWRVGECRDMACEMRELALDVSAMVLFGYEEPGRYRPLAELIQRWMTACFSPGVWFFQWDLPGFPFRRLLRLAEELDVEVRRMIEERRREAGSGDDVMSVLVRAHDALGATMTEDELVGEVSILFTAAHETTTVALTWTLFLLSQHPAVVAALAEELKGVLHGEAPRVDQFERLPLLDRVIKESLRILPPVAWGTRAVDRPTELGAISLPKGSRVLYSQYVTHHMPEIYPEPRRFNPERWEGFTAPPYAYIPFGGGPRLCIGHAFSMSLLRIALSVIVQRVGLALAPGVRVDRGYRVTIAPKHGMPMIVRRPNTATTLYRPAGTIHDMVDLTA